MLTPGARVHIIGVGGAGMSAVARVLLGMGCTVSGSDARESDVTRALRDEGVDVHIGHDASFVHGRDVVLWSPAIPADHVERRAAIDEGARCLSRAELLEELSGVFAVLGLTGTHGKTTATSMMAHVLASAGEDVGRMLGADVRGLGPNGVAGTSGRLVMEVDESYGTFATITPQALGLLNVEADHLDHYGSLEALEAAFAALVERTAGPVVVFTDDPGAARVAAMGVRSVVGVGRHEGDWRISA